MSDWRFFEKLLHPERKMRGKVAAGVLLLLALLLLPTAGRAQFGIDPCCAIVSVGLKAISGLLRSVIAQPLSSIEETEQQIATFEREVVFPAGAITNARATAQQLQSQLRQMFQLYQLPIKSASLPAPQHLEAILLSHNPQNAEQVHQSYVAVYGPVMSDQDAPQQVRDLTDASDAQAQAALKKALELDALADVELAAADQMNQQIQRAAPGSVPILEAQAAAWNVRANAYTQSAYAELMRVRAIDLASASAIVKAGADSTTFLRKATGRILGGGEK